MFKDVLTTLIKENHINAMILSKSIGVPKSIVYAWKSGEREPSMENLKKLSDYFKVSLEYLCEKDMSFLPEREANLITMLRTTKNISEATYNNVLSNFEDRLGFYLSVSSPKNDDEGNEKY